MRCVRGTYRMEHTAKQRRLAARREEEQTAERLRRAIAIRLVIAWRIMLMTLLGRETPELLFSDEAVRLLAIIGGYLARKSDPPPGHQLLWRGYMQFHFMCLGFELLDDL